MRWNVKIAWMIFYLFKSMFVGKKKNHQKTPNIIGVFFIQAMLSYIYALKELLSNAIIYDDVDDS